MKRYKDTKKELISVLMLVGVIVAAALISQNTPITGKSIRERGELTIVSPENGEIFMSDTLAPITFLLEQDNSVIHSVTITRKKIDSGETWTFKIPPEAMIIEDAPPYGRVIDFFGQYTISQRKYEDNSDKISEKIEFMEKARKGKYELTAEVVTDGGRYLAQPIWFELK